jgi:sorting nexin-1/2
VCRFVNHIAKHAMLRVDPCFIEFVEKDGDLPKATGTSSLSGAGVMKLFSKVGDSFGKMTFKMEETDQV